MAFDWEAAFFLEVRPLVVGDVVGFFFGERVFEERLELGSALWGEGCLGLVWVGLLVEAIGEIYLDRNVSVERGL